MKSFRQILEETEKTVVTSFMRANPPTAGHAKVIDTVHSLAKQYHADHSIRLSHSQDSKKNPLSPEKKLSYAKSFFPHTNFSVSSKESPSYLTHAAELHRKGYQHLVMVAGSDRAKEYEKTLNQYNGKFDKEGNGYHFKSIKVVSAGDRDATHQDVSGISASKMRKFAASGDYEHFKGGVPSHVGENHTKNLYNDVRHGMKIAEERDREAYISGKIFNKGDLVEDLLSGEECVVEFRGDNYVTILRGNGDIEKRFINDVSELEEGYFRFHRNIKLGPVTLNVNKHGESVSLGKKSPLGITLGRGKETFHVSTPIKGLSFRDVESKSKRRPGKFATPGLEIPKLEGKDMSIDEVRKSSQPIMHIKNGYKSQEVGSYTHSITDPEGGYAGKLSYTHGKWEAKDHLGNRLKGHQPNSNFNTAAKQFADIHHKWMHESNVIQETPMTSKADDFDYSQKSSNKNPDGTMKMNKSTMNKPNSNIIKPLEYTGSGSKNTYGSDYWKKMREELELDEATKEAQLQKDIETLEKSFHKIDKHTGLEKVGGHRQAMGLVKTDKGFTLNHYRGSKIKHSWEYDKKGKRVGHNFMEEKELEESLMEELMLEGLSRAAMKLLQHATIQHKTDPEMYHKYAQAATFIMTGHNKDLENYAAHEGRPIRTKIMHALHTQGGDEGKAWANRLGFHAEDTKMKSFIDFKKDTDQTPEPVATKSLEEVAPPGMEDLVKKLKKRYPGHEEKAFATAWSIYDKKAKRGISRAHDLAKKGMSKYEWTEEDFDQACFQIESEIFTVVDDEGVELTIVGDSLEEKYIGFEKLKNKLAHKKGVSNPGAVAAAIGRKKYGKEKFQSAAAHDHSMKGEGVEIQENKVKPDWHSYYGHLSKLYGKRDHSFNKVLDNYLELTDNGKIDPNVKKTLLRLANHPKTKSKMNQPEFAAAHHVFVKSLSEEKLSLAEAVSRKHFQMVADTLKAIPNGRKRTEMAIHHAQIFAKQNPRFDHEKFFKASNVKVDHYEGKDVEESKLVENLDWDVGTKEMQNALLTKHNGEQIAIVTGPTSIHPYVAHIGDMVVKYPWSDLNAVKNHVERLVGADGDEDDDDGDDDKVESLQDDTPIITETERIALKALIRQRLDEKWAGSHELNPAKKGMFAGRDKASLSKEYNALKAKGPHKEGSAEFTKMKELSFAMRAKGHWKEEVENTNIVEEKSGYTIHKVKTDRKWSDARGGDTGNEREYGHTEHWEIRHKGQKVGHGEVHHHSHFGIGDFNGKLHGKSIKFHHNFGDGTKEAFHKFINWPSTAAVANLVHNVPEKRRVAKEAYEQQPAIPGTFDAPASEFDSMPGYVVGAYSINGRIVKLVRMGNMFAPIKVVVDHEEWKDAQGEGMRFTNKAAALAAFKDMQSGEGRHDERQEIPTMGDDDDADERVGAGESHEEEGELLDEATASKIHGADIVRTAMRAHGHELIWTNKMKNGYSIKTINGSKDLQKEIHNKLTKAGVEHAFRGSIVTPGKSLDYSRYGNPFIVHLPTSKSK